MIPGNLGSIPNAHTNRVSGHTDKKKQARFALVRQWIDYRATNPCIAGSSPAESTTEQEANVAKMLPSDPAHFLLVEGLNDPEKRSRKKIHRDRCYICEDEEFSLMGLPLCNPCPHCPDGHVAADDEDCDRCGKSIREEPNAN